MHRNHLHQAGLNSTINVRLSRRSLTHPLSHQQSILNQLSNPYLFSNRNNCNKLSQLNSRKRKCKRNSSPALKQHNRSGRRLQSSRRRSKERSKRRFRALLNVRNTMTLSCERLIHSEPCS